MEVVKKYTFIFRCRVPKCSYASKRLYNLQRHEKTHNKEHWRSKRFPCPSCAYAAATRAHLKRHMGNKHPTQELSADDLTGLPYEYFESKEQEDLVDQEEHEAQQEKSEIKLNTQDFDGPVTVLQMVRPQSPYCMTGGMYNISLEGESFRLIPVELLPSEVATTQL